MTALVDALWRGGLRLAYKLQLVWWYLRRPVITGSYVAVWHEGRVLAIRNSYREKLTLPAGGIKRGESPREAARRELLEEVGIVAAAEDLAYHGEIVNPAGHAEDHAHVFELHLEVAPAVAVDRREVVWAEFLDREEVISRGVVGVVERYLERASAGHRAGPADPRAPRH